MATVQIIRRLLFCSVGWKLRATADFLRTKEGKREFQRDVRVKRKEKIPETWGQVGKSRERGKRQWAV